MANSYLIGTIQIPSSLQLTAITKADPMIVTVSVNTNIASNSYIAGQLVKFFIPFGYGMQQANNLIGKILSVSGNDITIDIDSRGFDDFSVPASGEMPASISPAGSRNLQYSNDTGQVAFQSLNNTGN